MKLDELASLLSLSTTTVSRALGGYPEVSEKTRARVVEAAARHGYVPNVHARNLATGQPTTIGCVVPISERNEIQNPIFADFLAGAAEATLAAGYEINLKAVDHAQQAEAYREIKSLSSIGGVIVQFPTVNDDRIPLLNELGLPFVVHGRTSAHDGTYSWVDVNNRRSIARATQFLVELGHRRIALVNGPAELEFAARRRSGYLSALAKSGIPADPDLIFEGDMTALNGFQAVEGLLSRDDPPTAIIAASTIVAWGVKYALEERDLSVGSDVSLVCFDDGLSYIGHSADMPLFTAVRSSVRTAGRSVATMLIDKIRTKNTEPQSVLFEADLIVGRSTGPCSR